MPKTAPVNPFVKIVLRGHILTQPWSIGLWCDAAGAQNASSADCVTDATALATAASTWATAVKIFWSAATKFEAVSVYAYAGGSLTSHANGTFNLASAIVGTSSTSIQPAFSSLVHTLLTGSSGASFRGRVYVPVTAVGPDATTHQYTVSQCGTFATALAAMLTAWQSVSTSVITNHVPVAISFTRGLSTTLLSVRVDTMPDTQHRRENGLAVVGSNSHAI